MCLKLISKLETVDKLPLNHTIFRKLALEAKEANHGLQLNANEVLYQAFVDAKADSNQPPP